MTAKYRQNTMNNSYIPEDVHPVLALLDSLDLVQLPQSSYLSLNKAQRRSISVRRVLIIAQASGY